MKRKNKDGTVTLSISDIIRDERFQGRVKLDKSTLRNYTQKILRGLKFDPVEITQVGKALILTDGWHRVRACELAGRETIDAVIKQGDKKQAIFNAIIANLKHGLKVKDADKKHLFRMYMDSGQYRNEEAVKSLREISEDFNQEMSHMTVKRWMKKEYRTVYRIHYSKEEGGNMKAEGFQPIKISEEPETFFAIASEAINKIGLVFESVDDEKQRGKLIWEAEALIERMKKDNRYRPFVPFDDYYQ